MHSPSPAHMAHLVLVHSPESDTSLQESFLSLQVGAIGLADGESSDAFEDVGSSVLSSLDASDEEGAALVSELFEDVGPSVLSSLDASDGEGAALASKVPKGVGIGVTDSVGPEVRAVLNELGFSVELESGRVEFELGSSVELKVGLKVEFVFDVGLDDESSLEVVDGTTLPLN